MSKADKWFMTFFVIICLTGVYALTYTQFGYELGLKKPKFTVGDCIRRDISSEFEKVYEHKLVLQVGKKQYNLIEYNSDDGYLYKWLGPYGETIEYVDEYYEKVKCPKRIGVMKPL